MRIGIIIGRSGDIDGVSLETKKWVDVLTRMGHGIYTLSGRYTAHLDVPEHDTLLPQLSFFSPECEWEQKRAFFFPDEDPDELLSHLEHASDTIALEIFKWVLKNKIDVILSENASALPCHLSMGMGIKKFVERTGIRTVCHDHDFYWERGDRYKTPHKEVERIVKSTFPLTIPHVKHAVINTEARNSLRQMFNIDSLIVPNVMDFNKPYAQLDDYNSDMLENLGMGGETIPLFQITRIVKRKGIETSIELIEKLDDKRIKLIITGSKADDERFGYFKELLGIIKQKKMEERVLFGHRRILPERTTNFHDQKIYSISDAYAYARACTYFSTYEGFGNAFVECILAKRPIFVNNYKPVFWPEIGSKGFKTVMIDNNELTDEAVAGVNDIIHNPKLCKEIAEFNFELGKKHFSYEVLEHCLTELFHIV